MAEPQVQSESVQEAATETPTTNETPVVENKEAAQAPENQEKEQQLEQDVKDAKTPAEKKAAEKRLEKFKIKVFGKEEDFEIDLNNKDELTKHFQLSRASQKTMQEKAEMEKGIEKLVELLKNDPWAVLSHKDIGHDVKKLAQDFINQQISEEAKSPEQKEKEKLETELKEIKEKYENEKKAKEKEEFERLQADQTEKITNDIISALEEVKLPKSPRAVKYMAEYMQLALENNMDVSAKSIAPLVKEKMIEDYKELLRNSPDEVLEQFIDKDIESRLQKKRLSSLKAQVESVKTVKDTGQSAKKEETPKKKRISDFLNE